MIELLSGLLLLIAGAELMVRAAVRLAARLHVRPLIIGLTIVALGSSAPQMAVSLQATLAQNADIAVGSVIGSSIFNILVTLGLSALIIPLRVSRQLVRLDIPLMIGASLLVFVLAWNEELTRADGVMLLAALVLYLGLLLRQSRHSARPPSSAHEVTAGAMVQQPADDRRRAGDAGVRRALAAGRGGCGRDRPGVVGADHRPDHRRRQHLPAGAGHFVDRRVARSSGTSPWAT